MKSNPNCQIKYLELYNNPITKDGYLKKQKKHIKIFKKDSTLLVICLKVITKLNIQGQPKITLSLWKK